MSGTRSNLIIPLIIMICALLPGQVTLPVVYKLETWSGPPDSTYSGLSSNSISDIRLQNDTLIWLGTGQGLSRLNNDSLDIFTYYSSDELVDNTATDLMPAGGVSAVAVDGRRVAAAVAGRLSGVAAGMGIVITDSSRSDWLYFEQPVDENTDTLASWFGGRSFETLPVTVSEQNVTYDASIAGDYLWIASWAGGIRRHSFSDTSWQRIPLPLDNEPVLITCQDSVYENGVLKNFYLNPRDPDLGNHNHKGFAVLAYSDTVWVGSANGINRGIIDTVSGCIDWEHYFFPQDGLSGNWVVSLARQDWNGRRIIWAVTLSTDEHEQRGLSYTTDDGETWHATLLGERAYNVVAYDSLVFAATENGLWRSNDGRNWALYKPALQALAETNGITYLSDEISTNEVFSALYDPNRSELWIGTGDGLAVTDDLNGLNWRIFRTDVSGDYVYPNPFFSGHAGERYVRFHIDVKESYVVKLDIFDFAMQKVYTQQFDRRDNNMGTYKWNGQDSNGKMVA
ncbi:MAG: hypothetical protein H8E14_00260, partial [Candidatus Marinimicrobia bacterium]|nr:hypothetical protein [Candidatus Neomarinimicrobiota bacterium]